MIETVGRYNAQTEPSEIVLNEERIQHWIARGAQPTNTVRKLMRAGQAPAAAQPEAAAAPTEEPAAEPEAPPAEAEAPAEPAPADS